MPGIRLHHPTKRNVVLVCPTDEFSANPHRCELCNEVHLVRTLHLRLDHRGDVIVAPPVFRRLRRAGLHFYGLTIENEVKRPPGQAVSLRVPPTPFNIVRAPKPTPNPNPRRDEEGEAGKPLVRLTVPERTIRHKGERKDGE